MRSWDVCVTLSLPYAPRVVTHQSGGTLIAFTLKTNVHSLGGCAIDSMKTARPQPLSLQKICLTSGPLVFKLKTRQAIDLVVNAKQYPAHYPALYSALGPVVNLGLIWH